MRHLKLALAGLFTVLAFGAVAQTASAYDLTFSPGGAFSASTAALTLADAGNTTNITCSASLEGDFETAAVPAAAGSQFGLVDAATIAPCNLGTVTALPGWALRVTGFGGTLPNALTSLQFTLDDFAMEVTVRVVGITLRCLYGGDLAATGALSGSNPYTLASFQALGTTLPKLSGIAACPSSFRANGTFTLGSAQTLTIT